MDYVGHGMSDALHVDMREHPASRKLCRLVSLLFSGIASSASRILSSIFDAESYVTGASGLNSVGEDKSIVLKTYRDPP